MLIYLYRASLRYGQISSDEIRSLKEVLYQAGFSLSLYICIYTHIYMLEGSKERYSLFNRKNDIYLEILINNLFHENF